ncbi:MAG: hypothetical protein A2Y89_03085 [Chloroflexi bacterium RBG_13_51_18]|nr:MAG: hypothetical protein A2Y89_03085 [Chloroflexi bacterium RBG_13_51_18]
MTNDRQPIEITEKDLIHRPATMPEVSPSQAIPKGWLDQVKDIINIMKELGIDPKMLMSGIKGFQPGQSAPRYEAVPSVQDSNPKMQMQLFIRILAMQYGDITVDELLERLRQDFGNRKLSELIK